MAWRFWPVVDLILVATFETEVLEVRSEVNLISPVRPEDLTIRGTALIGLDLDLTIGMRLHMDRAYASRALVFAKIEMQFGHCRLRSCHPI